MQKALVEAGLAARRVPEPPRRRVDKLFVLGLVRLALGLVRLPQPETRITSHFLKVSICVPRTFQSPPDSTPEFL